MKEEIVKTIVEAGHMLTVSGLKINLLDPDPKDIRIEDIAHGLSLTCRWNGHVPSFYSVAEHSVKCASLAPKGHELAYLFHDAEEAYWGDIISPIKVLLRQHAPWVIEKMELLRKLIYAKYGVVMVEYKTIDREEVRREYDMLMVHPMKFINAKTCLTPEEAKEAWLETYNIYKINKEL